MIDIEVVAELKSTLERIGNHLAQANQQRQREWLAESPTFFRIRGTSLVPASGFLVVPVNPSGPPEGFYWNLRRLSVSGVNPSPINGRADIFITSMGLGQITSFTQLSMADWADQASSLPLVGNYGEGELQLRSSERLHVIVSGATLDQRIIVNGVIQQVQEAVRVQTSSV